MSFTLPNNPKDLDPSYKMALGFRDCFGKKKAPSCNRRHKVNPGSPSNAYDSSLIGRICTKLKWTISNEYVNSLCNLSALFIKPQWSFHNWKQQAIKLLMKSCPSLGQFVNVSTSELAINLYRN